jgi:hypothetical protein
VRLSQLPGEILSGSVSEISQNDLKTTAAQELAEQPHGPEAGDRPASNFYGAKTSYQVIVKLGNHPHPLWIGAPGTAKIEVDAKSLGARLADYLRRTFRLEL